MFCVLKKETSEANIEVNMLALYNRILSIDVSFRNLGSLFGFVQDGEVFVSYCFQI